MPETAKTCATCGSPIQSWRKYCSRACYYTGRKSTAQERFWSKVDRRGPEECWPWNGPLDSHGYGLFCWENGQRHASRYALEERLGRQLGSLFALHTCDNPRCVNPNHLFPGTQLDNLRDMARKGRTAEQRKTACVKGHPFDEVNTRIVTKKDGRRNRACRTCARDFSRAYLQRKRQAALGQEI